VTSSTGLLAAPGDAGDLARALARIATDPAGAAAMGRAGATCQLPVLARDASAARAATASR
jgi:hypothetical protein